jgi:hypothetical protein
MVDDLPKTQVDLVALGEEIVGIRCPQHRAQRGCASCEVPKR